MSRSGNPRELLGGTMHYAIVMLITTILFFNAGDPSCKDNPVALYILGALAGGDGLADILGRRYGAKRTFGFGGALLTDKQRPYTLHQSILEQAAAEVNCCLESGLLDQLILVHGVGSFGHPPVVEHRLHKGLQSQDQLIHLTDTQNKVLQLRLAIAETFHKAGVTVYSILPSSCITASNFELKSSSAAQLDDHRQVDASGAMLGKLAAVQPARDAIYSGLRVQILSMIKEGNLTDFLAGKEEIGTLVTN
jgi:isopentenyl phosphate kinase